MRKVIFTIILFFIFCTLVLLALPTIISVLGLEKYIAGYIESELNQNGEQDVSLGQVHLSWSKLDLDEAKFVNQTEGSSIEIKGIRFGYDAFKLVSNLNQPFDAVEKIYLLEPTVILREGEQSVDSTQTPIDSVVKKIQTIWSYFVGIDQIQISNAKVILKREKNLPITLAQNLDGWLQNNDSSSILIYASGGILNSPEDNISVACEIDPDAKLYHALVSISEFDLTSVSNLDFVGMDDLKSGSLNGELDIVTRELQMDSLKISGDLFIEDAAAKIASHKIEELNLHSKLEKNKLDLISGSLNLNNSPLYLSGQIANVFSPRFTGLLKSDQFDPLKFIADSAAFSEMSVKLDLDCTVDISRERLYLDAYLSSEQLTLAKQSANDFKSHIIYDNGLIDIRKVEFTSLDFQVLAAGDVNIKNNSYAFTIDVTREFEEQLLLDKLSAAILKTNLQLNGNYARKSLNGIWDYDIISKSDTMLCLAGIVLLEDGNFKFKQTNSSLEENTLLLEIADIFNNPRINYGYIENPPIYLFVSRPWIREFFTEHQINAILSGPINRIDFRFAIQSNQNPDRNFTLYSHVKNLLKKESQLTGDIGFNGFRTSYDLSFGRSFLRGSLSSETHLSGTIDLELDREDQIRARLNLNEFPLSKIIEDSSLSESGYFNGNINIGGTLDNPGFIAEINADKFIINDIGYYKLDMQMRGIPGILNIDTLQIALNNVPVLSGHLDLDMNTNILNANASGSNVDAEYIVQTLFPDIRILTGTGDFSLAINGSLESPKIHTALHLKDGMIDSIAYDKFDLAITDSVITDSSFLGYKNHLLNVDKFEVVKGGHFHIIGDGVFPIYDDGVIDLQVNFDGDILSFLPHWDSFFLDGASFSSIDFKLSGTPSAPRIVSGRAEVERGELWLKSVARHVENISGVFEFEPVSKTLYIKDLRGEVDGAELIINTVDSARTSDGILLKPWYFDDLDLNFGILAMTTSGPGVKLEIDGFMLPNESGILGLSGKTQEESFYLAGPVGQPTAWGRVVYSDSRFSFPFATSGQGKPSPAIQFLTSIYWDVEVVPGEDLQYVRSIPAFLGEVDTELDLDLNSGKLEFKGILDKRTFHAIGELAATRGRLEYLDLNFRVENFGVIFNRTDDKPEVYGRAWTTVRDSIRAVPKTIYLELYAIDKQTGQVTTRSRWEDFRFRLVSADPAIGETQEQVLAYLGYSVDNIKEKATEVGGAVTENYVIRPLLRPLERRLERYLGFDLVRFNSSLAKNLFLVSLGNRNDPRDLQNVAFYQNSFTPYALLFESSEVTLGKYLSRDLYLTYTGQFVTTANETQSEFNINHSLGLEYRFFKNILVEFEYYREALNYYQVYSDKSYLEDFKIRLRHSFSF